MSFSHKPVLLFETVKLLDINPLGTYVDGTAGGGGHAAEILKSLTTGKLILFDQDPDAVAVLHKKFSKSENVFIVNSNFANMQTVLNKLDISFVDGVLLDLGVSSFQLDNAERGFSYQNDSKLDMRMSKNGLSAHDVINEYSQESLTYILWNYGEERFAKKISGAIVSARVKKSIETTLELVDIVKSAIPAPARRNGGHPAKRTFQAIRIEVNQELENLEKGLDAAFSILKPSGKLAVITFHSLEDRIVKRKMDSWRKGCLCPVDFPICICGHTPKGKLLNKKPILPTLLELADNPRARSAKLRGITKNQEQ